MGKNDPGKINPWTENQFTEWLRSNEAEEALNGDLTGIKLAKVAYMAGYQQAVNDDYT